jgi:hypothetical protein
MALCTAILATIAIVANSCAFSESSPSAITKTIILYVYMGEKPTFNELDICEFTAKQASVLLNNMGKQRQQGPTCFGGCLIIKIWLAGWRLRPCDLNGRLFFLRHIFFTYYY